MNDWRCGCFVDDFPRSFTGKAPRQELARRYEEEKAS